MTVGYIQGPALIPAIFTVLDGLVYPASTDYTGTPKARLQGIDAETVYEEIELKGMVEDGEVDWENTGRIQQEDLTVTIEIRSHVPSVTGPNALARVNTLAQVVQAGFRDATTGLPAGLTGYGANLVRTWRFSAYDLEPVMLEAGGWGYTMTLKLRLRCMR